MTMQCVTLESMNGNVLRGVLHRPAGGMSEHGEAAILLPGLTGTRTGPHRILFDLAQRLADSGRPTLRCDLTGSGYSDGPPGTLGQFTQDAGGMIRFMEGEFGAARFLLGGICRGSKVALAAALHDPRVSRLILLSCPRLREVSLGEKTARRRWHHLNRYLEKALALRWVPRLLNGDLNLRLIGKAIFNPIDRKALERIDSGSGEIDFSRLDARMLFVYGERDPDLNDHLRYYRQALKDNVGQAAFRTIAQADQGFYSAPWHQAVLEAVDAWMREQYQ